MVNKEVKKTTSKGVYRRYLKLPFIDVGIKIIRIYSPIQIPEAIRMNISEYSLYKSLTPNRKRRYGKVYCTFGLFNIVKHYKNKCSDKYISFHFAKFSEIFRTDDLYGNLMFYNGKPIIIDYPLDRV